MDIREGPLLEGSPSRIRTALLGYLSLTKPRVIELLLVTTIPAMLLAHRGSVDPLLILNTLVGGLLVYPLPRVVRWLWRGLYGRRLTPQGRLRRRLRRWLRHP